MKVAIGELGIKDLYAFYKQHTEKPLSYKVYKQVNEEYLAAIMELIIDQGYNFRLPSRLGYWRIQKRKVNYNQLSINWKATNEAGFTVYHLNQHSDGYKIRFLWEKKRAILKKNTKRPYSFTLSRDRKRQLAKNMQVKNGHTRYPEEVIIPKTT